MLHRYDGYLTHNDHRHSWKCTCGSQGAIRWDVVAAAKSDYLIHLGVEQGEECELCGAVTTEASESDWGPVCDECLPSTMTKAELIGSETYDNSFRG